MTRRRESGLPCVSMYEVAEIEELKKHLRLLVFREPNEAWLDFVYANRSGAIREAGMTLCSDPWQTTPYTGHLIAYEEGILTKEETLARLKVKKLYDQMTFATETALAQLRYIGQLAMEEESK